MALPVVEKIGEASRAAWPEVSLAMDTTIRTAYEIAEISDDVVPKVEEYASKGKNGSIRRRKVCEETIWVLARLGWLRTGPEREVILVAKALTDALEDHESADVELADLEDALIASVMALPEYLTTPATPEV